MNWRTARLAIIDTETTGIETCRDRVVDLGVVIVENFTIVERFGWLVNPGVPIPAEASAIHGITDDMVTNEQPFVEVAFDFAQAVRGCIPVAYNSRFDRSILTAEFLRAGFADPPALFHRGDANAWIDAFVWAKAYNPFAKGKKLGQVAERFGVELGQAHRAVGDCETTARVLERLASAEMHDGSKMSETFSDLVLRQRLLTAQQDADFLKWLIKQPKQEAA